MIYTEQELLSMSDKELEEIYMSIAYVIMPLCDKSDNYKLIFSKRKNTYGCKTLGEARNRFDKIAEIQNKRLAKKQKIQDEKRKAECEQLTANEKALIKKINPDESFFDKVLDEYNKAKNGNISGMVYIGLIYGKHNINIPKKSFYWIEKAEKAGNSEAKYWLGLYYLQGYGVKENRVHGTSLIIESAKKGNKHAINCLQQDFSMSIEEIRRLGIKI